MRFWSMLAIVAIHSVGIFQSLQPANSRAVQAITTPFKFGTIAFFIISGFLLGERLQTCNPVEYFTRRLRKVFLPWSLWLSATFLFIVAANLKYHHAAPIAPGELPELLYNTFTSCIWNTAFWFVPNLLAGIAILLVFRRYLDDLRLGVVLFAVDLVYVVNIYKLSFRSSHTQALFGFVFHLWLGAYSVRHFAAIRRWVSGVPAWILVSLSLATCAAAFLETRLLSFLNNPDPLNTLRITNQAFSLCLVLLLLKVPQASWPRFIDVRRHTFGIYLTHTVMLSVFTRLLKQTLDIRNTPFWSTDPGGFLLWILLFGLTYTACVAVISLLARWPALQWTVGVEPCENTNVSRSQTVPAFPPAAGSALRATIQ